MMNVYRKIEEGEMRIQMVGHTIQCVFYRKLKTGVGQIRLMLLLLLFLLLFVCVCVRACFSFTVFFSPIHSISHSFDLALLLLLSFEIFTILFASILYSCCSLYNIQITTSKL